MWQWCLQPNHQQDPYAANYLVRKTSANKRGARACSANEGNRCLCSLPISENQSMMLPLNDRIIDMRAADLFRLRSWTAYLLIHRLMTVMCQAFCCSLCSQ